ncbi:hypothetical protein KOI35_26470 [Actinoplanes bogorensis]|uniref:Uncharacterized protein n=1 Tax=Paractinoplanes bogorensis TaxID=1610840 RepID=A0ABS5YUD1_9ACTN|nr:hypothetical protein [Actinoplanes bogorensis]MBU2667063.1 hypothetical protein [Actinoplanes bogorensis]
MLDLYARLFDGNGLGPDEYVISSDEKTSFQAPVERESPVRSRYGARRGAGQVWFKAAARQSANSSVAEANSGGAVTIIGAIVGIPLIMAGIATGGFGAAAGATAAVAGSRT